MAAHAKLSASGSDKWLTCTMSPAMENGIEDEDSVFSMEGTCAHAVGEARVSCWLGTQVDERLAPGYSTYYSYEFSDYVDEYVDYVKGRVMALRQEHGERNVTVLLEQRLDFSAWVPEGFGTGDVVIIVPGKVIVIDLKFGAGIFVGAQDNSQIKLYGLGAYAAYDCIFDFKEVEVVIHQPRKSNVGTQTITVEDLLHWAENLVRPRALIAWAALQARIAGKPVPDRAAYQPGDHCSNGFCKARFTCSARARFNLALGDLPYSLAEPDTLTVPQLEALVGRAETVAKWAKDCKAYLLREANEGRATLVSYRLGEGRSFRTITNEAEAAVLLEAGGFAAADIYKAPELVALGKLEKLVGAKKLTSMLGDLLIKPPGAATLVTLDSKAESVAPRRVSADEDFA